MDNLWKHIARRVHGTFFTEQCGLQTMRGNNRGFMETHLAQLASEQDKLQIQSISSINFVFLVVPLLYNLGFWEFITS